MQADPVYGTTSACAAERPLIVDLDGTLLKTDLSMEAFLAVLAVQPFHALWTLAALRHGMPAFKAKLEDLAVLDVTSLPFNEDVLRFIKAEKERGRAIHLASAAAGKYVSAIAQHLCLEREVFSSNSTVNLKGEQAADLFAARFGEKGFDYIGNAAPDEFIWRRCHTVLIANASDGLVRAIRQFAPEAHEVTRSQTTWRDYANVLRIHQWLKNILVFVPALLAHEWQGLIPSALAFLAFCLCASSAYIVNDLLDLRSDREHERKRHRPFASGRVPIPHGLALAPTLMLLGLIAAFPLGLRFLGVLLAYIAITFAYSFFLKRKPMIDVITLACLYGIRVLAGGVATGIFLSPWLGALCLFLFFYLALIKRCAELWGRLANDNGDPLGRGYRLSDLPLLQTMATASGFLSVLVLALYFNSETVAVLYSHHRWLWIILVLALYWISRVLLLTSRGLMNDDPVIFAATDRVSQIVAVLCAAVVLVSI